MQPLCVTIQMKANEQYVHVGQAIMKFKVSYVIIIKSQKARFLAYDSVSVLSPLVHTYRFHVNALCISPFVSEVLVQFLFSGLRYFVKFNKVLDNSQISVKSRSARV